MGINAKILGPHLVKLGSTFRCAPGVQLINLHPCNYFDMSCVLLQKCNVPGANISGARLRYRRCSNGKLPLAQRQVAGFVRGYAHVMTRLMVRTPLGERNVTMVSEVFEVLYRYLRTHRHGKTLETGENGAQPERKSQ